MAHPDAKPSVPTHEGPSPAEQYDSRGIEDLASEFVEWLTRGQCNLLGTGLCCKDRHFDRTALPEPLQGWAETNLNPHSTSVCNMVTEPDRLVSDRDEVTCKMCKGVTNG